MKSYPELTDQAFADIINGDGRIKELDRLAEAAKGKYDAAEYDMYDSGEVYVAGVKCRTLTPAIWCKLYAKRNNFATFGDITLDDVAQMMAELTLSADPYDPETAAKDLLELVSVSFLPLEQLPETGETLSADNAKSAFNLEWALHVCSKAAQYSGESASAMWQTSLNAVCCLYVLYLKEYDTKHVILRKTPQDIQKQVLERIDELAEQYHTQKQKEKKQNGD